MRLRATSLSRNPVLRFLPALLMMLTIFLFSAGSALELPEPLLQRIVNKGGHMIGYGLLALAYWRMFEFEDKKIRLAWLLAVLYAMTDEFHQSFVPGRHPTLFDVLVFDNLGALISLRLAFFLFKSKQPAHHDLVVEERNSTIEQ